MRRALVGVALLAALLSTSAAAAGSRIQAVDASAFPSLRVTYVAPAGSPAPPLRENGRIRRDHTGRQPREDEEHRACARPLAVDARPAAGERARGRASSSRPVQVRTITSASSRSATRRSPSPGSRRRPAEARDQIGGLHVDTKSGTALYDAIVVAADRLAPTTAPAARSSSSPTARTSRAAIRSRTPSPQRTRLTRPSTRSASPVPTSPPRRCRSSPRRPAAPTARRPRRASSPRRTQASARSSRARGSSRTSRRRGPARTSSSRASARGGVAQFATALPGSSAAADAPATGPDPVGRVQQRRHDAARAGRRRAVPARLLVLVRVTARQPAGAAHRAAHLGRPGRRRPCPAPGVPRGHAHTVGRRDRDASSPTSSSSSASSA